MSPELEQRVREHAYSIWEREGRPHGRAEAHWLQALADLREAGHAKRRPRGPSGQLRGARLRGWSPDQALEILPPRRRQWCTVQAGAGRA
ncbi:DUF2934 domain-containing protein [Arenibaculum pallidiluteum]|uniref:DUF2934 domain-containing protein n=1 Tax=Arenibaculum pallidiluteum TaxID=2812559 RepID=UPI001A9661EF|nr:DUF2934 domain-containing protein [Arenibaculum pallidiluteum]